MRRSPVLVGTVLAAALGLSACGVPAGGSPAGGSPGGGPGGTAVASGGTAAPGGCPPIPADASPAIVDYVDFVRHGGVEYLAEMGKPITLGPGELGAEQFRVTCNFSELGRVSGRQPGTPGDGAAGRLPVGTPVHAVKGWPPACRLAAKQGGAWQVYLATVPGAPTVTYAACARSTSAPRLGGGAPATAS